MKLNELEIKNKTMKKLLLSFSLLLLASCSSNVLDSQKEHVEFSLGSIIYSYGPGKMQYQAQIDPNQHIVVYLKPLLDNTTVEFIGVLMDKTNERASLILKCKIIVKIETDQFAALEHVQELFIPIDPLPVENITLDGKVIFTSGKITVLAD